MEAFIIRNIVPKLAVCLQEFIINPYQQHLGELMCGKMVDVFMTSSGFNTTIHTI